MKKIFVASMLVASCLYLTACGAGSGQGGSYADPYKQSKKDAAATKDSGFQTDWQLKSLKYSTEAAGKITAENKKEQAQQAKEDSKTNTFLGNWIVKRDLVTGSVGAYGQREIDRLLNKKIVYSQTVAKFNDELSCTNPKYQKAAYNEEMFMKETRLTFKAIGINAKSIVTVNVFDSKGEYWSGCPASHFIIKDKNTLILADQGQYFELIRE
jgi:hypothetical protein